MRFSYRWLKEYLPVKKTIPEILDGFTISGMEVESAVDLGALSGRIVIGQIEKITPHPQAENLANCLVNAGGERPLNIVCGARNMKEGDKVPVALEGAQLSNGITIKHTRIRGEVSEGMLCAGDELGFNNDHSGIFILPEEFPIGEPLDMLIDISITPNRGDCLSVTGLARDLSAYFNKRFSQPAVRILETMDHIENHLKVTVQNREACPRYGARYIRGVRIGPSPGWLAYRLESAGLRPLNNVIDATNYVMLEYGHPIHAFDIDRISNHHIIIRNARKGENLEMLDGTVLTLTEEDLLIADPREPIALAGVMGGKNSGITPSAINVALECAYFDPLTIRKTRRRLGKQTEASYRFERNVDIEAIPRVLDRVATLIQQISGGEIVQGILDVKNFKSAKKFISLSIKNTNKCLGTNLGPREIADLLVPLNLEISNSDTENLLFCAPSFRNDLVREIDLIEEAARMYGYGKIKPTLPYLPSKPTTQTKIVMVEKQIRDILQSLSYDESITYSFTSSDLTQALGLPLEESVKLTNPISSDQDIMRASLLPGFIQSVAHNLNRGMLNLRLYEIGKTFKRKKDDIQEEIRLIAGICGEKSSSWKQKGEPVDFYDIKGLGEALSEKIGFAGLLIEPLSGGNYYHPRRSARFIKGEVEICRFGELHPLIADCLELKRRLYIMEMNVSQIAPLARKTIAYQSIPKYPSITRDLALVLDDSVSALEVEELIRESAGAELESLVLFDLYKGDPVPRRKKSLAYSLVFRAPDRTLTDEEANETMQKIFDQLKERFNATLR
ncbi:phenylalanine--tRNA ligase subunit beta [Candidatus Sumerlaeota bacterium]|nr:phenylalanine--tRNA ligase subunit beta [Candidatus Sumerlaeota bacterium]